MSDPHLDELRTHAQTQEQAGEVITHLAFYAGWPNAFSAPVAKEVFAKRAGACSATIWMRVRRRSG
jgi:4-carboxymuconolactone decarboxylase